MKGKGFEEGTSTIGNTATVCNTAQTTRTESAKKERHECKLD